MFEQLMPQKEVKILSPDQCSALITQANNQEALALVIGLNCGISFSELVGIRKVDMNLSACMITIITKKGSRRVYLTPHCIRNINIIVKKMNEELDLLFQYTEHTFKPILSKWSGIAGFDVNWQTIRHTYAKRSEALGIPVKLVAHNIGVDEKALDRHYDLDPVKITGILKDKVIA